MNEGKDQEDRYPIDCEDCGGNKYTYHKVGDSCLLICCGCGKFMVIVPEADITAARAEVERLTAERDTYNELLIAAYKEIKDAMLAGIKVWVINPDVDSRIRAAIGGRDERSDD